MGEHKNRYDYEGALNYFKSLKDSEAALDIETFKNALAASIEALITAVPTLVDGTEDDGFKCPACGNSLMDDTDNFCGTCGQCLMWEV
jgi:rubrerythrin